MIISHICQANVPCRACVEKAATERSGIDDARVAEARLGVDEDVEKPGCVGEVGTHARVWRAEEVKED
jgi:hypothetical protein